MIYKGEQVDDLDDHAPSKTSKKDDSLRRFNLKRDIRKAQGSFAGAT